MSYDPKAGDASIIEHPSLLDRHRVVFVEKPTAKMLGVQYIDHYGKLVTSDTHSRKPAGGIVQRAGLRALSVVESPLQIEGPTDNAEGR